MEQIAPPQLDSSCFERNLTALSATSPDLAERVRQCHQQLFDAPQPPRLAYTRDQRLNFQLPAADGSWQWFGKSSIPAVRAEMCVDRFDTGTANVLLPGLGQGSEAEILTRHLGRHRAVFVWEECIESVTLSLYLHDYATALADCRLIFIHSDLDSLARNLADWLMEHPGHLCPNRIMLWPWQQPIDLANCQAAVESAYRHVEQQREVELKQLQQQLANLPAADANTDNPSILFCSLRAEHDVWELIDSLDAAARQLGWPTAKSDIRLPGDIHPLARAKKLRAENDRLPNLAILIDIHRRQLGDLLPAKCRATSWLTPKLTFNPTQLSALPAEDSITVSTPWLSRRIEADTSNNRRISVTPPPCFAQIEAFDELDLENRPIDVLLLADLCPIDAKSFGYELNAQATVWNAAIDILNARIESFQNDSVDQILTRAERKTKIRLEDEQLRSSMIRQLDGPAANTLLWKFIAQSLTNHNITFKTAGHHWPGYAGVATAPSPTSMAARCRLISQAKILVHADLTGTGPAGALLAAGQGTAVVARQHPLEHEGGIFSVLEIEQETAVFLTARELVQVIRDLLKNPEKRREMAQKAYHRCRKDHLAETRLRHLISIANS